MQQCDLLTTTEDLSWSSSISREAITKNSSWEQPSGLWLMDSVFRGCNLGFKGRKLDSSDFRVTWTVEGPRGGSLGLRYARLDTNTRPVITIKHGNSSLLNMTQSFTVMMWVKTDDVTARMPILEGREGSHYSTLFCFFPSRNLDQVQLAHSKAINTHYNSQGKLFWRHLVFRYMQPSDYKIYLNGTLWPIHQEFIPNINSVQPEKFQIGYRHRGSFFFRGSMACVSIYEKALSSVEFQTVKNACP